MLTGGAGILGLVLVVAFSVFSGDPTATTIEKALNQLSQQPVTQQVDTAKFAGEDDYEVFASKVVGTNNDVWRQLFKDSRTSYQEPKLVLFRGATQSACSVATSAVGPHYCPLDNTIYLDETFFNELKAKLGGSNDDVAQAYVISHEVGHHVQNELGILSEVQRLQQTNSRQANALSVKLELQADCLAGIWANSVQKQGIFEPNEIQEAISAAKAVGDDHIQQQTQGQVVPEEWTHGSSAQRAEWFNRGLSSGQMTACNTFE